MESQLQLIDMPEDSMRHILERCDFVSIQCLRKTCHTFRNFIDETKPLQLINDINISGASQEFSLTLFANNDFVFYPAGGKIQLNYNCLWNGNIKRSWHQMDGDRWKIIANENILDALSRDLRTALECRLSKWNEISMSYECPNLVMEIIKSICPGTLVRLCLAAAGEHWNMSELVKLEQWNNAKELDMRRVIASADIESYSHFETAKICFENVTMDDLCKLKKIFLNTSSITKRFELHGAHILSEETMITALGQPYLSREPVSKYWYFKRSDNYVLCVNSSVADFIFSIITKDDVPREAIVI
ncbi:unnamed protein product [Caenorhabditis brenneri]